jgi:hypothetical protein
MSKKPREKMPAELLERFKEKRESKTKGGRARKEQEAERPKHTSYGTTVGGVKPSLGTRLPCVYDKR